MNQLTRGQLVLYAAVGIAVLLVGARWMSAGSGSSAQAQGVRFSSSSGGSSSTGVSVAGAAGEDVVVDVTGAVRDAGVYRLPAGSRVDDAVKRAGGATAAADVEHINLAAKLTDGQQVAVPEQAAAAPDPGTRAPVAPIRRAQPMLRSACPRQPSKSSTPSTASGRSRHRTSSTSATSTVASARSTTWTRSRASGRPPWRLSAHDCSLEAGPPNGRPGGGRGGVGGRSLLAPRAFSRPWP